MAGFVCFNQEMAQGSSLLLHITGPLNTINFIYKFINVRAMNLQAIQAAILLPDATHLARGKIACQVSCTSSTPELISPDTGNHSGICANN